MPFRGWRLGAINCLFCVNRNDSVNCIDYEVFRDFLRPFGLPFDVFVACHLCEAAGATSDLSCRLLALMHWSLVYIVFSNSCTPQWPWAVTGLPCSNCDWGNADPGVPGQHNCLEGQSQSYGHAPQESGTSLAPLTSPDPLQLVNFI